MARRAPWLADSLASSPALPLAPSLGLSLAAGAAQALSIAWPAGGQPLPWLQVLSLAVLAGVLWRQPSWRRAALTGWAFATAWLALTWWWLFISMHTYGGLPAPLAALAVLALAAALGLYYGLASALAWRLAPAATVRGAGVFAAAWLLAELARGRWFTGFPWGAGGYAHVDGPLSALAPWVGVYGIGAAASALAALAAALVLRKRVAGASRRGQGRQGLLAGVAALGLAVLVLKLLPAGPVAPQGAPLSVALLQGNIPQDEKFQPGSGIPLALQWYAQALREARADLVVAPETAIPLLPRQLPPGYLAAIEQGFASGARAALVGLPLGDMQAGYTNSVLGLRPGAPAYRFDKFHLVPFGEFIPPWFRWFTDLMHIPLGDFARGGIGQASFEWRGQRLAPNVCYEDLFGEELAARFADPARAPTVLVNVSNIAWFGDTVAIDQHLHISRMRALELRRPVIRATNTGATAIIDAQGRVLQRLPSHTRGVLHGQVQGYSGLTPYARWTARWQLAPLWGLAAAIVLVAAFLGGPRRNA